MRDARAVHIDAPETLRLAAVEPRAPGLGEALVEVAWAGICGSDREVLAGTRPKDFVRYPLIPGHEWSGTVVAVGELSDASLVGRAVVGEGFRSCGRCPACFRGDTNLCQAEYRETGFTEPGAWATYLTVPARLLHVLPKESDLRAAAALEPAACVAAACLKAAVVSGERVAVVGGGTLGLLATQLLRASEPSKLIVVDPHRDRGELAQQCGASEFLSPDEAQRRAGQFDVVLEAAGASDTARLAMQLARRGGRIVLTGIPPASTGETGPSGQVHALSPTELVLREITVLTVFGAPSRAWAHAVRAFATGVLDPSPVITHEVPLEDVAEAFRILTDPSARAVKVLLRP
ncbi:alcohol dehydrogenase catalytic domain-containing protein [Pendulispora rubella]|uniref:Alcohol dehydrogenase catalytic domain-containing protein n=1 Tax=Pendulispora rubella TaxID=2741070 RepID=A0ABZ2L7P9_9BACT